MKNETSLSSYESLLQEKFQLTSFRRGQKEIIHSALMGRDVLAVLPTGGGKSLCYQFPALFKKQLVIVISPLIALMKDQVSHLEERNISAGALYSGQSDLEKRQVFSRIKEGEAFILYLSPERAQKEGFQKWIQNRKIALFAIDEAHCVSQWGHDFRPEYAMLKNLKSLRSDVPILALTASATPLVLADIARHLELKKPDRHVHGFYRSNLFYQVENCADQEEKLSFLLQALKQNPEGRVIIYCGTRKVTEELATTLEATLSQVGFYHAGLTSQTRTQVQQDYEQGKIRILVATNAFGMGIDHPDVRLVVHFQMPSTIDSLYQEMGRAGRDSKPSTCLMLYSKKDKGLQSYFIQQSEAPPEIKSARWRALDALINYSEGGECRHAEILTYYKDSQRLVRCGHCDSCEPASDRKIKKPVRASFVDKILLRKNKKTTAFKDVALETLTPEQEVYFLAVKDWRKAKAKELDTAAFMIFSDKTLRHLVQVQPQSLDELKNVYGFGESKTEKLGPEIIKIFQQR